MYVVLIFLCLFFAFLIAVIGIISIPLVHSLRQTHGHDDAEVMRRISFVIMLGLGIASLVCLIIASVIR